MKKQCTIFLILIFILGLVPVNFSYAANLSNKLKGKILLQVESNGEAWYVNPDNEKKYYLGRPEDAFQVMRNLGLGISNKNFDSFNGKAPSRLSGKILLKVEDNGKAYYVNPADLKLNYLGKPADAFQVMRKLGLGITNDDLSKILENGEIDTKNLKLLSNSEIINKIKDSVVYIETADSAGSGFIIESTGYILTNAHVVQGVSSANIILSNNTTLNASVVGRDENIDLALLKVNKTGLKNASLGDSDAVKQGDEIFTLGYPFGIKGDVSFKDGTISRELTDSGHEYFEISAEIHPGNSGGPLVNKFGQVVGINTAILGLSIQGVAVGETIKLVIPINVAIKLLPELKSGISRIAPKQDENTNTTPDNPLINPPSQSGNNLSILDNQYETFYWGNGLSSKELRVVGIIKNNSSTKSATNIKLKITLTETKTGIKQEELVTLNDHKYLICIGKDCELKISPQQSAQFKEKITVYDSFIVENPVSAVNNTLNETLKNTVTKKIEVVSADWLPIQ